MSPQPGRSESSTPNAAISILWHANYLQPLLMERFGATKKCQAIANPLRNMVSTRRLELLTSSFVSLYLPYSAGPGRNVPRRSARSFINTKNTGTRIST